MQTVYGCDRFSFSNENLKLFIVLIPLLLHAVLILDFGTFRNRDALFKLSNVYRRL